jgi:hypothetical protein
MTTQTAQFKLEHQEILIFQHKRDKDFIAIGGAGKNKDGHWRSSIWFAEKKDCLFSIGSYSTDLERTLENCDYIESLPPQITPVPVGIKVRILPNAKEECEKFNFDWKWEEKEKMIGKVVEIREQSCSNYRIWDEKKDNYWLFPRTAFVIADEEDEKWEELVRLAKDKGFKLVKE